MKIAYKKMRFGESASSITLNREMTGFYYMLYDIRVDMRLKVDFIDFYRFKKV